MKLFLKIFFKTVMAVCIFFYLIVSYSNISELLYNQAVIIETIELFNEQIVDRHLSVKEEMISLNESANKPSYEYLKSVTVRMINFADETETYGSIGTGVIVKVTEDYTYILTNRHVAPIDSSKFLYVEKDGKRYLAKVLKNGVTRDLSLVQIVGKIPKTSVIKGLKKVKEQDKIYSVGMYLGMQDIYSEGTVAGWNKNGERLINMPSLNGCSGSGIFDKDGNLVALLFAGNQYNYFGLDTAKAICVPYIAIYVFLEEIL